MPIREYIASWLRDAGNISKYDATMFLFEERAAQVEQMRCEECRHRCYTSSCSKFNQHILGLDEGCFQWEAKEVKE